MQASRGTPATTDGGEAAPVAQPVVYLVRETKGHADIERLRFESEGWKIKFGQAHFVAIGVDYGFGDAPEALIVPTATEG